MAIPVNDLNESWRPYALAEVAAARAAMLDLARSFFAARGVLEVETPLCQRYTVTEPHIDSVAVDMDGGVAFLQTSPEYQMKRLLAAGYPDIYQICKVFRAGETGRRHLVEFSMAEWYRRNYSLDEIMQETVDFAAHLMGKRAPINAAAFTSYRHAFLNTLALDPLTADIAALGEAASADARLRESLGDDRDAWLDLLMSGKISAGFEPDRFTVVYHYPASQAALARLHADDSRIAERFELYLGDVELANGFVELNDADEQKKRFESDRENRRRKGLAVPDTDPYLLAALRSGMPDCAGVAVGLDRSLMLVTGADSVRDVTTFTLDTVP